MRGSLGRRRGRHGRNDGPGRRLRRRLRRGRRGRRGQELAEGRRVDVGALDRRGARREGVRRRLERQRRGDPGRRGLRALRDAGRGGRRRRGRRRAEVVLLPVLLHRRGRGDGARTDDGDRCRHLGGGAAADEQRLDPCDEIAEVGHPPGPLAQRLRRLLEALGERTACAEDQRLDGGLRQLQLVGDLAIREPLPLAEEDRAALVLRHLLEDVLEADQLVAARGRRRRQLLDDLEVGGRLDPAPPPRGAASRQADVVRDLEQPGRLELRLDPAPKAAEGVEERALHGVLGLLARAELVEAVAEDLRRVPLVELMRRIRFRRRGAFDAVRTTYGRNCGQLHAPLNGL